MTRRQVFVSGTWDDERAAPYAEQARTAGRLLAEAGCDMACGPGTGIAAHAIAGFRSVTGRAGLVRYYLPAAKWMRAVGEVVRAGADEIVRTRLSYPMRNIHQVGESQGLVVVTGSGGTLQEINTALEDAHIPVGILAKSGAAAEALVRIADLFPDWESVAVLDDAELVARFVLDRLTSATPPASP